MEVYRISMQQLGSCSGDMRICYRKEGIVAPGYEDSW